MKKLIIFLLLLILLSGCASYNPEKYVGNNPNQFWTRSDNERCPVCNSISQYVQSYYGKDSFDTLFLYYYKCYPNMHLWVMIEQKGEVVNIEEIK